MVDENQILLMANDSPLFKDELKGNSKIISRLVSEGKLSYTVRNTCNAHHWDGLR